MELFAFAEHDAVLLGCVVKERIRTAYNRIVWGFWFTEIAGHTFVCTHRDYSGARADRMLAAYQARVGEQGGRA